MVVFGLPEFETVYIIERLSPSLSGIDGILKSVFTQPGDRFGSSVVIDGEQVIVGAENATTEVGAFGTPVATGAAYLFSRIDGAWDEEAKLAPSGGASDYAFGGSVNGFNAQQALIGAVGRDVTVSTGPGGGTQYQTFGRVALSVNSTNIAVPLFYEQCPPATINKHSTSGNSPPFR